MNLKDVIVRSDGEVVTAKGERHIWESVTLFAFNSVLPIVALLSTHLLVKKLSKSGWESNEGSSSVEYDTSVVELSSRVTEGNSIEINLPIGLTSQWDGGDLAGVVVLIDTTEDSLRLISLSVVGIAEVEGENGFVQKTLVDHLIEGWDDPVDGDSIISETQDTIKSTESKCKTWLLGGFGEDLVFDREITNGQSVLRNETAELSRPISDLERSSILLVCR